VILIHQRHKQTDGRTDDTRSQGRAIRTIVHRAARAVKMQVCENYL